MSLVLVFGWLSRGKKWELCRDYLAKKAGRDLSAFKAKNMHMELLTIFFANRTKGLLLHRILLLHKPRTETMYEYIFPATATTLPHCETGYLAFASDSCGQTQMSLVA